MTNRTSLITNYLQIEAAKKGHYGVFIEYKRKNYTLALYTIDYENIQLLRSRNKKHLLVENDE